MKKKQEKLNNNFTTLFKLMKFEVIRIWRKKIFLFSILLLPIFSLLIFGSMDNSTSKYSIAIYDSANDVNETDKIYQILENIDQIGNIKKLNSEQEGFNLLNENKIYLFVTMDSSTTTGTVYYDGSSPDGIRVKEIILSNAYAYAYDAIIETLENGGIHIIEDYASYFTVLPYNQYTVTQTISVMPLLIASFLAVLIMFGMAFSLARDKENGMMKQIKYMPISVNKYLISKTIPYVIIGLIQCLIMFSIARHTFNLSITASFLHLMLVSLVFILACIGFGIIISNSKTQIASAFLAIVTIILPVFISVAFNMQTFPLVIRLIFCLSPITSYIMLINALIFKGVILPLYLIVLIVQIPLYYVISCFLVKKHSV